MADKTAIWKCRRCGNLLSQELKRGQKPVIPEVFCECKHKDWELERYDFERTNGGKIFEKLDEIIHYNLNQGIFQNHFYFGKKIELEGNFVDSVIFDNGCVLIDYSGVKVGGGKKKNESYGRNEIKEAGLNYRISLVPTDNAWSNKSIADFCKNAESVGGVVSAYVEGSVDNTLKKLLYINKKNKKNIHLTYLYRPTSYPTLTTPIAETLTTPNYTKTTLKINYTKTTLNYTKTTPNQLGKTLFEILIKTQDYFMDVTDKRIFLIGAAYIIATYCFELFRSIGYLFFNSESDSGKTKFAEIIGNCSFHTIDASDPSDSALFRAPELFKGLMVIDDFDKMSEEKRNALLQILKIGYKKKGKTMRVERKRDVFQPKFFDCYCPKIITNISGLEPVTLSRCIPIHLMKTLTEKGKREPDDRNQIWQLIRDFCHIYVLTHWKRIQQDYESYECTVLNNRDLELVKGPLAIVKGIDSALHQQMLDFLVNCFGDRAKVDLSGDWDYALFASILANVIDEPKHYSTTQITSWLKEHLMVEAGVDTEQEYKRIRGRSLPTPRFVGRRLSRIPLIKKRRVGAGVEYELSKPLVEQYMRIRGYYFEEVG